MPSSGPRPLLSRCGQIVSAGLAVNQAEDEVPHDPNSIVDGNNDTRPVFPSVCASWQNGFVGAWDCFVGTGG
jgi:hypothetical protein